MLSKTETVQDAAARMGVSEQTIWAWRRRFVEAGHLGLDGQVVRKKHDAEDALRSKVHELKIALGEAYVELANLRKLHTVSEQRQAGGGDSK